MIYDLIVVGLGPAGVSAAIYAKRAGLKVLCLEKSMIGGYLNYIDRIDNYPGLYGISGPDFAFSLYDTISKMDISYKNKEVLSINNGEIKEVVTNDEKYLCKNVILSTGRSPRKIGIDKEQDLYGKGISHCALCDGAFYKDKVVAVVGGGNSALQEALYLSNICKEVYLIHRKEHYRVNGQAVDNINKKSNIVQLLGKNVSKLIENDNKLSAIILDDGKEILVDGLFIYIGFEPNTRFIENLNIVNKDGYIEVNKYFETEEKGIYAVGDIVKKDIYQISTAVNDGVIAATNVIEKLNEGVN